MTTFSMYSASIPGFKQILNSLLVILDKAEAHATEKKIEPNALLQFRLFPDMLPFTRQVQIACDFAKGAAARQGRPGSAVVRGHRDHLRRTEGAHRQDAGLHRRRAAGVHRRQRDA